MDFPCVCSYCSNRVSLTFVSDLSSLSRAISFTATLVISATTYATAAVPISSAT
jgi:hypothetical protein